MTSNAIIYNIFNECREYIYDEFWRDRFYLLACNKFPPKMRYDAEKNIITLLVNNKKEVIHLPTKTADVYVTLLKIMKEKLGIKSKKDIDLEKNELSQLKSNGFDPNINDWKKIKPKFLKDKIINEYIETLKKQYNLTDLETRRLNSLINLEKEFKNITAEDIIMEDSKIKSINNLFYNEQKREFTIKKEKSTFTPTIPPEKEYDELEVIINGYIKKISK